MSRRALIAGIAGLTAYGLPVPAAAAYLGRTSRQQEEFEIRPRSSWAGDSRAPTFDLEPEDVQLLVVHHTLIPSNRYNEDQAAQLLRDIYDFHTGPEKRWPDIAYNFMVDQFGTIWEAREGSLDGPVRGSATGGNQGFSQLCCFLGDLSNQPPTEEAAAAMTWLLAHLADRYDIDTSPGTTVGLVSLGSSRFAAGESMTLPTLAGHRDVSLTACPGDAGYAFLQQTLPGLVNARRAQTAAATTTTTETTPPTTMGTTQGPTTASSTTTPVDETTPPSDAEIDASDAEAAAEDSREPGGDGSTIPLLIGGAALAATGVGIVAVSKKRLTDEEDGDGHPVSAAASDTGEREDGTIDVPTRLGLEFEVPDSFVPGAGTEAVHVDSSGVATEATAEPSVVAVEALQGPQRVWWAVTDGFPWIEEAVEELSSNVHFHATHTPEDPAADRREWSRLDSLLVQRAGQTPAAVVAARSDSVFVLRSKPCLVVVTRPDGVETSDLGRDALSISRRNVARLAVYFDAEQLFPDIEVTG